jgi:hypothetical protein
MPIVETVTLANPGGGGFTFEGRFLREPADALRLGATVQRVWYTIGRDDEPYDDFFAARRDAGRRPVPETFVCEHLVFRQPDGPTITQAGRLINLDPTRSYYNTRNADAFDVPDPP